MKSHIDEINDQMSDLQLRSANESLSIFEQFNNGPSVFADAFETNANVLKDKVVQKWLNDKNTKFDLVVGLFVLNELGYYVAHRLNATLAIYCTIQSSASILDRVVGQPTLTAITPSFMLDYQYVFI